MIKEIIKSPMILLKNQKDRNSMKQWISKLLGLEYIVKLFSKIKK